MFSFKGVNESENFLPFSMTILSIFVVKFRNNNGQKFHILTRPNVAKQWQMKEKEKGNSFRKMMI